MPKVMTGLMGLIFLAGLFLTGYWLSGVPWVRGIDAVFAFTLYIFLGIPVWCIGWEVGE